MLQTALKCARDSLRIGTSFMLFQSSKNKIVTDEGFRFCLHYFDEEHYIHHKGVQTHKKDHDPLLPPYPKYCLVSHLNRNLANHYCFINLYQTSLGHIVISSADSDSKQTDNLNFHDCSALSQVIRCYERKGIAYFNYGLESGCSQMHKHMQYTTLAFNPLFDEMKKYDNYKHSSLGIKFFASKLTDDNPHTIYDSYMGLLEKFFECSEKLRSKITAYNFVISEGYAILVPRKLSVHPRLRISLNSLGVCGHYFIWEGDDEEIIKKPIQVLRDLCVEK